MMMTATKKMISITLVTKADDEKDSDKDGQGQSNDDDGTKEEDKKGGEATHHSKGGGDFKQKLLKSITDDSFQQNTDRIVR